MNPKFPDVQVQLSGEDGNAFFILGTVIKEMKKHKIPQKDIDSFREEATMGDYDNLLQTCMKYVEVM